MERQATQPAAVPTGRKRRRVSSSKKPKGDKDALDMKAIREREMTLIGVPRAEAEAVVIEATNRPNQSQRSRNFLDQSESSIQPM